MTLNAKIPDESTNGRMVHAVRGGRNANQSGQNVGWQTCRKEVDRVDIEGRHGERAVGGRRQVCEGNVAQTGERTENARGCGCFFLRTSCGDDMTSLTWR
jgi:hypothetical protein